MTQKNDPITEPEQPAVYQIIVKGHLDYEWADWFEVSITRGNKGETILTCTVVDQAALYGLLRKIRDLGMPLISVNRIEA